MNIVLKPLTLLCLTWSSKRVQAAGTELAGSITTRTNVEDLADIALDLRDMEENCDIDNFMKAQDLYRDGRNSRTQLSLKYMSTLSSTNNDYMDPTFAFHMYGLTAGNLENIDTYRKFANDFVEGAFNDEMCHLAVEGALALNLWMHAAHELWDGLSVCARMSTPGFNADAAGISNDALRADEFIALWIGSGQTYLASDDGYSLYTWTHRIGEIFGTNSPEASVNSHIIRLYEDSSGILSMEDACTPGSNTVEQLWTINNRITTQMMIPQVQNLIHAMKMKDQKRITLYSKAVLPQMSQCRRSTYIYLKEHLLDRAFDTSKFHEILEKIQSTYECLGFECSDIGQYRDDSLTKCLRRPMNYPIADYNPTSDVHQQSKIDLDILQMKILLKFDSDKAWNLARYMYMYGKNSIMYREDDTDPFKARSLQKMALSPKRSAANPFFRYFELYFNDPNYADNFIIEAFDGEGKWGNSVREQRSEVIIKTVKTQVMFMYVLAEMADAVSDCENGNPSNNDGSANAWDEVAAYIIGSLEGHTKGGSDDFQDGELMWNLANKRCVEFGRENSDGFAIVNAYVMNLLYAGKGELSAMDCINLDRTSKKLQHITLIPMMQSVIRYAIKNQNQSAALSDRKELAEGEAFAKSILPVIAAYNSESALTIQRNMIPSGNQIYVTDGPQFVADSFLPVMEKFGIECDFIGKTFNVDTCKNYEPSIRTNSSNTNKLMSCAFIIAGAVFMLG